MGYTKIKADDNICGIEKEVHYIKISWDSWCGEGCDECKYSTDNKLICESCISGYRYDEDYEKYYNVKRAVNLVLILTIVNYAMMDITWIIIIVINVIEIVKDFLVQKKINAMNGILERVKKMKINLLLIKK